MRRTLLIIDDDAISRSILSDMFSERYDILEAANGQEGLDVLQRQYARVSLILLDIQMPVMDGYAMLRCLKEDPLLVGIPVIVTTVDTGKEDKLRCLELGATDLVSKPYDHDLMQIRIENTIRLRESAATLAAVEFDMLTGLRTRQAFLHHADLMLRRDPGKHYTLVVSDVEEFRRIGTTYGRARADEVLLRMADHLRSLEPRGVLTGRLGDDTFVGLMEAQEGFGAVLESPHSLQAIERAMPVPGVSIKYGVYEDVDTQLPAEVLCDRAMMALHTVKHRYGMIVGHYSRDLQARADREHQIEMTMQDAYDRGQFLVYYQPKHDAHTGELIGAEALIRWQHPLYGFMSPGEFIPVFERTGFITHANYAVWKQVCADLRAWQDEGLRPVPVSVNSSQTDFDRPDLLPRILQPLRDLRLDPSLLHI